jgi:hypothetical protein
MHNEHHDCYKGRRITTRLVTTIDWSARAETTKETHSPTRRFSASCTVVPPVGEQAWQWFTHATFHTATAACKSALDAAKKSIDEDMLLADGSRDVIPPSR